MSEGMAAGNACEQTKAPQVEDQLQRMEKEMSRAQEVQVRLRERLTPVLTNQPPCGEDASPEPEMVPLANAIRNFVQTLAHITSEYGSIIDRIEL